MRVALCLLILLLSATAVQAESCEGSGEPASTVFMAPASGETLSGFGLRRDPLTGRFKLHPGLDIRGRIGDPVRAAASGRVVFAGEDGAYGRLLIIQHGGAGLETAYAHLESISVKPGDCVRGGQTIGAIGQSGHASGPHLHFEVRKAVDPAPLLAKERR